MHYPNTCDFANGHVSPPPRLLIVDDDEAIRELHALLLSFNGYDVETSGDGAAALERLAEQDFDLVVTDCNMPIIDGATLVLALRSAGSDLPVVIISASFGQRSLPPGVAREIAAMVPKPARAAEILSAVGYALRSIKSTASGCVCEMIEVEHLHGVLELPRKR